MNYPSKKNTTVRIFVKNFSYKTMEWEYVWAENVASVDFECYEVKCWHRQWLEVLPVKVYMLEWKTNDRVGIYEISRETLSVALWGLGLVVQE